VAQDEAKEQRGANKLNQGILEYSDTTRLREIHQTHIESNSKAM
jgi:hypothetical protein